jgi:hypothetical protein
MCHGKQHSPHGDRQSGRDTQPAGAPGAPATGPEVSIDEAFVRLSEQEKALIAAIETARNSRVIAFIAADSVQMKEDIALVAFELLKELGKTERLDMVLHSRGGQTEVPAKLIPLLRNFCTHLGAIVPFRAHSAATHIAIGANEIIMGPMSELGPVDPTRSHPLLPKDKDGNPIPISVQDLRHVVDLLKREGPDQNYTPEALATIFSAMFEYVHPLAMGAIEQSYALAKLISRKLLSTHMDPRTDSERIERITNELSDGFKSHVYQIGWKEAKELGLPVVFDDGKLYESAWALCQHVSRVLDEAPQVPPGRKIAARPIFVMATAQSKRVLYEFCELKPDSAIVTYKPVGAKWFSSSDFPERRP